MPAPATSRKIKTKNAPKKVLSSKERIQRLFKSLCAQIDGGHFKNALKTCDKILRIDGKDDDALNTKLFLLLQTEQYEDALTLISTLDVFKQREFEKAYALYRLHKEEEANMHLSQLKGSHKTADNNRGVMHLEAQLAYRQHAYEEAFDLYTQLLDSSTTDSEEHADLITNLNAAQTHLDFLTTGYMHALDALPAAISSGLETAPPPAPPGSSVAIPTVSAPATSQAPPAARKVRMKRVPKSVVPGVTPPPDPERWIKKSERSTFGQGTGRRRKAGGGGGGATQGSTAVEQPAAAAASGHGAKGGKGKKKK